MRSRDQVIWDFVQSWLNKAEGDLRTAELILREGPDLGDISGFHSQQAVEKFEKAFLVRHQVEFPKTHDLARVRDLIARVDPALSRSLAFSDWLTPFGVEARYPGPCSTAPPNVSHKALTDANRVKELVLGTLEVYLEAGRPESV